MSGLCFCFFFALSASISDLVDVCVCVGRALNVFLADCLSVEAVTGQEEENPPKSSYLTH